MNADASNAIRAGFERGETLRAIATELGLSYSTVRDGVVRLGLKRARAKSRSPWLDDRLFERRGVLIPGKRVQGE